MQALESAPQTPSVSTRYSAAPPSGIELLVQWNATAQPYPQERCIHELFEEQVQRTPDAVAVVYEEQSLTYAELNARANRLARHYLRSLGVGPDRRVGICVERSLRDGRRFAGDLEGGRGVRAAWIRAIPRSVWRTCCRTAPRWWC